MNANEVLTSLQTGGDVSHFEARSIFSSAIEFAEQGYYVLPCNVGTKIPYVKEWQKRATRDVSVINQWVKSSPKANVGIHCGKSGIIVIDFDVKTDKDGRTGMFYYEQWSRDHPEITNTVTVNTGSGGIHLYYKAPVGTTISNTIGLLHYSIDVRSQNGYVLAPPSCTDRGSYTFQQGHSIFEMQPAELPTFFVDLLTRSGQYRVLTQVPLSVGSEVSQEKIIQSARYYLKKYVGEAELGNRHEKCFKLALQLRDLGLSHKERLQYMIEYQRSMHQVADDPFTEEHVIAVSQSVDTEQPRTPAIVGCRPIIATSSDKPLTDIGNAERLVERHGDNLRYCHTWRKWLFWDGTKWRLDTTGEINRRAKDTIRSMLGEAYNTDDDTKRQALVKHQRNSESDARIKAMVSQAEYDERVSIDSDSFDTDIYMFNVLNGVIDLKTGELLPHMRDDHITKIAPVSYDGEAKCPTWIAFLNRIMDGNRDNILFLQKALGYSLTGDTGEQCLFILYGTGCNGKSTLLDTVKHIMGEFSQNTQASSLMVKNGDQIRNDIARLKGSRFVTSVEVEDGARLAESLIKQLTGGDIVTARYLYSEHFEFKPQFKLWLATNHKPVIKGTDNAIWRRIRLIPFTVTIPEYERDRGLPQKLITEAPGILNWMIEGCIMWQSEGLMIPDGVKNATEGYKTEMDAIALFLQDKCKLGTSESAMSSALYDSYFLWCNDSGEECVTQKEFTRRLEERGLARERQTKGVIWKGISLL